MVLMSSRPAAWAAAETGGIAALGGGVGRVVGALPGDRTVTPLDLGAGDVELGIVVGGFVVAGCAVIGFVGAWAQPATSSITAAHHRTRIRSSCRKA